MIERWVFTKYEYARLKINDRSFNPTNYDEFVALPIGCEIGIIAYRNGKSSNRWADGTVGVSADLQEEVSEAESFATLEGNEIADVWLDVETNNQGEFIRLH